MGERINNINNYGGVVITGDVYGGNFGNGNQNINTTNISTTINDPVMIEQLLKAADMIKPGDETAKEKVQEIKDELKSGKPKVGKLQACYDWLRKTCTAKNVLEAVKVFGELLIVALK